MDEAAEYPVVGRLSGDKLDALWLLGIETPENEDGYEDCIVAREYCPPLGLRSEERLPVLC